jgi:hypothetical protein
MNKYNQDRVVGKESKTEKKRRHMAYMDNLIYSKDAQMRRKLFQTVEQIHSEERECMSTDLVATVPDLNKWSLEKHEPVNFEVFVFGKYKKQEEENEQAK